MFSHVICLLLASSLFTMSESTWRPGSKGNDSSNLIHIVNELTSKFEELKNDREKDVADLSLLKAENLRLKDKMEMETDYLRQRVAQLESSAQQSMSLLKQARINRETVTTDEGYTAFYVLLDHPIHDQSHDMTIRFNQPITNVGSGYNPTTGIFTCAATGLYFFSWSVGEVNHGHIYSELKKNGGTVGWAITGDTALSTATSQSVILHLDVDDQVDVRITYTGSSPVVWEKFSSFSGFLIV